MTGTQAARFWDAWKAHFGEADDQRLYEVFSFGDSAALADELAALVMAGTKRASAGLLWAFEHEAKPLPWPGALSIVTDAAGTPLCLIETTQVDVVPLDQVGADFAATEGEGDGSLAYWRDAHTAFSAGSAVASAAALTPECWWCASASGSFSGQGCQEIRPGREPVSTE